MTEELTEEETAQAEAQLLEVWANGFVSGIASLLHDQGFPDAFAIDISERMVSAGLNDPAVAEVVKEDIRCIINGVPNEGVKHITSAVPLQYPEFPDQP